MFASVAGILLQTTRFLSVVVVVVGFEFFLYPVLSWLSLSISKVWSQVSEHASVSIILLEKLLLLLGLFLGLTLNRLVFGER